MTTEAAPATPSAPAAPPPGGATLLTSAPPAAPASLTEPKAPAPAPGSAEAALAAAGDGRPEWAPEKYWDPSTKSLRHEDLGRGYQNLEKLIGYEKIPVPKSDDDAEGWARWYKAAGRPDDATGYEFKRPDLKDMAYDEDGEASFRNWAYANGLSKKQASNLYEGYAKLQMERYAASQLALKQAASDAQAALMREHGAKYDSFISGAKTAMTQFGDDDFRAMLDRTGVGNDPAMIRVMGRIGKELSGDSRIQGKPEVKSAPQDIERAISEFRAKNKDALYDKHHPDHARTVSELSKLFEAGYGNEPLMVRV